MRTTDDGLEIDDDWWRKAEKRVRREHRRAALRRRLGRARGVLVGLVVVGMLLAGGAVAYDNDLIFAGGPGFSLSKEDSSAGEGQSEKDGSRRPWSVGGDAFTGTPAEAYPETAAGLVTPPARAVGRFSTAEVAAALRKTRELLLVSFLDPRMVERRDSSALLAHLSGSMRDHVRGVLRSQPDEATVWMVRFAPGARQLAPARVKGAMTVGVNPQGVLRVRANYVFVYALTPHHPVYDRAETHVIVRSDLSYEFYQDGRWRAHDRGVSMGPSTGFSHNIDCELFDRGLIDLPREAYPDGDERDDSYYDPSRSLDVDNTCP